MKKILLLFSLFTLLIAKAQTQDTLYVWKAGVLVNIQSIKPMDMDSITFRRPITIPVINLPSVTICNQIWTNQNLDVTTYSDGTPIPQVTDPAEWGSLTTGAWCYYNNSTANSTTYGKLYNWYAVAGIYDAASAANPLLRKKLAPTGWHVATDADWTQLTDCLEGATVAGGKMKSTGTSLWIAPNADATNESGFTALPIGFRNEGGFFQIVGYYAIFWSSTEFGTPGAWIRSLDYDNGGVFRNSYGEVYGLSVRCIKD